MEEEMEEEEEEMEEKEEEEKKHIPFWLRNDEEENKNELDKENDIKDRVIDSEIVIRKKSNFNLNKNLPFKVCKRDIKRKKIIIK